MRCRFQNLNLILIRFFVPNSIFFIEYKYNDYYVDLTFIFTFLFFCFLYIIILENLPLAYYLTAD